MGDRGIFFSPPMPIYVSPGAQKTMARKTSGTPPQQTHHYHVTLNTHDACQCNDDVTMSTANERNAAPRAQSRPSNERPLSRGERPADPAAWISEMCARLGDRLAAIFDGFRRVVRTKDPYKQWFEHADDPNCYGSAAIRARSLAGWPFVTEYNLQRLPRMRLPASTHTP